jgi:hypothetical protein
MECRRRKVACSMTRPCVSCVKYKCEDRCKDKQNGVNSPQPSSKTPQFEESLKQHGEVLNKVFPGFQVEFLAGLSADQLVSLLDSRGRGYSPEESKSSGPKSPIPVEVLHQNDAAGREDEKCYYPHDDLFDGSDRKEYGWEEEDIDSDCPVADDVNGLDITRSHTTSYLGAESVGAVLSVIFKLGGHQFDGIRSLRLLSAAPNKKHDPSSYDGLDMAATTPTFSYVHGIKLIDTYFEFVHPSLPIIHEATFRQEYSSRQKKRSSWLALLYMVFAFGTIVLSDGVSTEDIPYFKAARYYLRNLGSGNLEYLQALILMGTHYLHYRSMPNTASALGGAAFKIACGLGLHRELPPKVSSQLTFVELELRRRIWWCLYAQEISSLICLGRPSMYGATGVTISKPQNVEDSTGLVIETRPTAVAPKIATIELCQILQKMEELQTLGHLYIREEDVSALDEELVKWYEGSPSYLRNREGLSLTLYMSLTSVIFLYDSARILLFRSFLLREALAHHRMRDLAPKRRQIVEKCLNLATSAIENLSIGWRPHKMSCWGAVWYLFQAVMVPLVMLYSEDRRDNSIKAHCQSLVERSIIMFEKMLPWRNTAEKSLRTVQLLFEASKKISDDYAFSPSDHLSLDEFLWSKDEEDLAHQTVNFCKFIFGDDMPSELQDSPTDF